MGKMIYEPKHKHEHDYPKAVVAGTRPVLHFKEPDFNSIWVCECGQQFKYRKYFMPSYGMPQGRWKKTKPPKPKPVSRGIGICNIGVPDDWEPPSAALKTGEVITVPAHLETKIIPRMVRHRTSGEYEVENRPQYRYVSQWFDGEVESDRNYQKFEMRIYRG